ncbi:hypothetical protein [Proteiniphilum sp. X52]|uniref:hypothetical protein n=1 Tax=Proteiniphilum sp. X52 TaxID=2382159 RepID=UPI000F0A71DA|nr:hypothetical protein [Proteiniphilum sp. X52]RNC63529.1 hypothetical protein D7D25_16100 [Proteiniphilum sp. X52]
MKNLFKTAIASLLFAALLIGGYSCSDDGPYYPDDYLTEAQVRRMIEEALRQNNEQLEFTKWKIVNITVGNGHWSWDDIAKRYEAVYELLDLEEFIYENGAVLGYVFIGEKNINEVQKLLPYVQSYDDADPPYTETISFDVQYKKDDVEKPSVAFYIQSSDLFGSEELAEFLPAYNFRLVLIW